MMEPAEGDEMRHPAIESARYAHRAAEIAGHAAGCCVAWGMGQCDCPGRAAIHGREKAAKMDAWEGNSWRYLLSIDPGAVAWRNSRSGAEARG